MAGRRKFSDQQKSDALAALDANGGNVNLTATQLGISESTLRSWAKNRGVNADVALLREQKRIDLSIRLKDIAHQILDILPDKLKDSNTQQLATALGIVVDKSQLLDNKPTERHEVIDNLSDDERVARIAAIFDRARTRRTGQSDPGE